MAAGGPSRRGGGWYSNKSRSTGIGVDFFPSILLAYVHAIAIRPRVVPR